MPVHLRRCWRRHRHDPPRAVRRPEQVGIAVSLVARDGRPRAGSRPDPRQHSLLAGPGLVAPPDLDAFRVRPIGNRLAHKCLEILAECLLAGPVGLGMARTGRYEGIAEIPGQKANRLDAVPYAEGIEDAVAKVAEPPPRQAAGFGVRPLLKPRRHRALLVRVQPAAAPRPWFSGGWRVFLWKKDHSRQRNSPQSILFPSKKRGW